MLDVAAHRALYRLAAFARGSSLFATLTGSLPVPLRLILYVFE
jgi:hypothetical protein